LVEFRNVVKRFGKKAILDGVSFKVHEKKTLCVIGGSGTGKSVTLKLLLGVLHPDEGEVLFRGRSIAEMEEDDLTAIRMQMGMLFQGGALFDSMTVFENIAYPLEERRKHSDDEIKKAVYDQLELVGLTKDVAKLFPADLSGGMIKRVGLARAIITGPQLILYDEPTAGLDPTNVNRIDDLIVDLQKRLKAASIVVTHHMPSVFKIADEVALLYKKKIAFLGTVEELKVSKDQVVRDFIEGQIGD
jgi:phospholipid/cholesterol/gamma-HCH transport system ATP-binding protein